MRLFLVLLDAAHTWHDVVLPDEELVELGQAPKLALVGAQVFTVLTENHVHFDLVVLDPLSAKNSHSGVYKARRYGICG